MTPLPTDYARDAEADLRVCEAASQGPWHVDFHSWDIYRELPGDEDTGRRILIVEGTHDAAYAEDQTWVKKDDADFCALAREALPAYIRRAVAAEAENLRLRSMLERWQREFAALREFMHTSHHAVPDFVSSAQRIADDAKALLAQPPHGHRGPG